MAYGTARMRAFYGAGDYSTALALQQYRGGYYPAGGWLKSAVSAVKKVAAPLAAKAAPLLAKAAPIAGKLGGTVMKALPGVGAAVAAYDLAKMGYDAMKGGAAPTKTITAGPGGLGVSFSSSPAGTTPMHKAAQVAAAAGHAVRAIRSHRRKRRVSRASHRRRTRRHSPRGDVRRASSGRFLTGHRWPKRHRRRHSGGGNVSFTTKDGRRVHFKARR